MNDKLTLMQMVKGHRELWDYLSTAAPCNKIDWPGWEHYPECERNCFACQYCWENNLGCEDCPFDWPEGQCCMEDDTGLYDRYLESGLLYKNNDVVKIVYDSPEVAKQIRDLPLKPKYQALLEKEIEETNGEAPRMENIHGSFLPF